MIVHFFAQRMNLLHVIANYLCTTGMADGIFDADIFGSVSDEALKDGLVPLDTDALHMLTDPSLVADADTENSFRLDQLQGRANSY